MGTQSTDTSFLDDEPTRDPPSCRLVVEEHECPPRVVALHANAQARIGRDDGLEISLDDRRVSRSHAAIAFDGACVTVRDLGSSNGTFVGETRLESAATLATSCVVRVGNTRIVVVVQTARRADVARPWMHVLEGEPDVIASDPATVEVLARARRVARDNGPVLIEGERGSGKHVVARVLHRHSERATGPLVAVDCSVLTSSVAELELVGQEKRAGAFEAAQGGTLLLDDVADLSPVPQARLLRLLDEHVIVRVGAAQPTTVDVRVIATTSRDVGIDVSSGHFREDLFARLKAVTITVPPLRSRRRDILPIVDRLLRDRGGRHRLANGVAALLHTYAWPGNVRELVHAVEGALALTEGDEIRPEHFEPAVRGEETPAGSRGDAPMRSRIDEVERRAIVAALERSGGNQSRAARELRISRRALIYKLERYGLKPKPNER